MQNKYLHYLNRKFKKVYPKWCVVVLAVSLIGCSTPTIYHWGKFEDGLYNSYVNEDQAQADVYLLETINSAEQQNLRVPPGAYADYGFLLFKRGDYDGAKAYFEKEKSIFPESSALMTKLIERIDKKETDTTKSSESHTTADQGAEQ